MNVNAVMNDLDEQKRQNRSLQNEVGDLRIRESNLKNLLDEQAVQIQVRLDHKDQIISELYDQKAGLHVDLTFIQVAHADCEDTIDSLKDIIRTAIKMSHYQSAYELRSYMDKALVKIDPEVWEKDND